VYNNNSANNLFFHQKKEKKKKRNKEKKKKELNLLDAYSTPSNLGVALSISKKTR